ncbi:MAG: ArsA family ATPase [Acidobacteriota bacterium]
MNESPLLSPLRRLLVVTGKGGVGKTAVAAALGHRLAKVRPLRVLVIEVDPRDNLHQMFATPPSGGAIVEVFPGLSVQNLKPRHVVDDIVRERLKIALLSKRVIASPVYEHFTEGAPGLKEVAILGHALRRLEGIGGPAFDLVILDAPATGHGVSLLAAPGLLAEVVEKGPFGELGRRLAEFVADDDRCGVVAVTTAEEMPVQEVLELRVALAAELGRKPDLLVVNGLYPAATEDGAEDLWRRRRALNESELGRLDAAWDGPRLDLPLLPMDRGPQLIAQLSERLHRGGLA